MLQLPLNADISQTALVVGTSNHSYLSFCVVLFEFVHSHQRSNTCYTIVHGVDLKVTLCCVFYTQSAVKLCVICKSMAATGILVNNSFK